MGGGGCTVLFLSLCGISRARLPSHISQRWSLLPSGCLPFPAFQKLRCMISDYQGGAEFDFEGRGNPLQTCACYLPNSKVRGNRWYYKQVIPPL